MRLLSSILLFGLSSVVFADAELAFTQGNTLISDGKVLFGEKDISVLYEDGQDFFVVIDHGKKTYVRLEKGFADEVVSQVNAEMEKALAGLPEAQRAMAEQHMKSMMPQAQEAPKIEAQRTGESDNVAGIDCNVVKLVDSDGTVDSVLCVAPHDALGVSSADYQTLIRAGKAMQDMAAMSGKDSAQDDFEKMGGIPIRFNSKYQNSELVSFDDADVDAARLQIPANYTEITVQDLMRQR